MVKGTSEYYTGSAIEALKKEFGYKSIIQVPHIEKIMLNIGIGEGKNNKNLVQDGLKALTAISGQKAVATVARNSIAGFKLREGMNIGAKVTLRRKRMYDFLARLVNVYIPRVRDFHGLPVSSFDGRGNYTLGLNDTRIFPELSADLAGNVTGLSIGIITSAADDRQSLALLRAMGVPFVEK